MKARVVFSCAHFQSRGSTEKRAHRGLKSKRSSRRRRPLICRPYLYIYTVTMEYCRTGFNGTLEEKYGVNIDPRGAVGFREGDVPAPRDALFSHEPREAGLAIVYSSRPLPTEMCD